MWWSLRALLGVGVAMSRVHAMDRCVSDHDCSLNGQCAGAIGSRSCLCHAPWTGFACELISVGLAEPGGAYGYSPNITSWGGNAVRGDDGQYHLYVAEIPGGLRDWERASQCAHAIAADFQGPFVRRDLVLPAECHNPSTLRHPVFGDYLMFHIGVGNGTSSGFLHTAKSPSGPWQPASTAPRSCNNPAPAYHPNGTLFVVCNHLDITSVPDWDQGSWAPLRNMGNPPKNLRNWEDPYLWFDVNGNFHVLYHVYCLEPYELHNECNSGHAFSPNGWDWTFSSCEPYSGLVNFTDGTSIRFSTRERPHLVFADQARHVPMGVYTAVSNQPVSPACASCNQNACSQCKVTPGRDWTFTQFQPFSNFNSTH